MTIDGMTITQLVDISVKHKITIKQVLLLLILESDKRESFNSKELLNVYKYSEKVEKWTNEEVDDLVKKKLMFTTSSNPDRQYPDSFVVADTFIESVFSTMSNFEEFWERYPGFTDNFESPNLPKVILKASVYEDCEALYKKRVKTKAMHKLVMDILDWGILNGYINMNIQKYISSRMWEQHDLLRKRALVNPMARGISNRAIE